MAYIDQAQDPRRRATAIAGVALVHAGLGALLLGMSIAGAVKIKKVWDPPTFTTPTPTPAPPPADQTDVPRDQDITAPIPPLDIPTRDPAEYPVVEDQPFDDVRVVDGPKVEPTSSPTPSPTFTPRAATPSNDKARWITNDDYPAHALRAEVEGTVGYRVIVGSNGRVSACEVTRSSGNKQLDQISCRLIQRRARFEAATDESGASVIGSYSGTVRWQIPD